MDWFTIAAIGVVANAVLVLALGVWIVGRKRARDEREGRGRSSQRRMTDALAGEGSAHGLAALLTSARDEAALAALVRALDLRFPSGTMGPADRALAHRLAAAAATSGLTARLAADLTSADPVRRGLAVLLRAHPGLGADSAAISAGLADADPDVRLAAAAAAERAADAPALVRAAREARLPAPRISERLGHRWATGTSVAALESTSDPLPAHARSIVLRALALAADPAAVPALIPALADGDDAVRIAAARALGGCAATAATPERSAAVSALRGALADAVPGVRCVAAAALGALGDPSAVPDLEAEAADPDWWVRANTAAALARLGPSGRAALERLAAGADRFAADRAREELARLDPTVPGPAIP